MLLVSWFRINSSYFHSRQSCFFWFVFFLQQSSNFYIRERCLFVALWFPPAWNHRVSWKWLLTDWGKRRTFIWKERLQGAANAWGHPCITSKKKKKNNLPASAPKQFRHVEKATSEAGKKYQTPYLPQNTELSGFWMTLMHRVMRCLQILQKSIGNV